MTTVTVAREYLVNDALARTVEWVRAVSPEAAVIGDRKGIRAGSDHRGDIIDCWCGERTICGHRAAVVR
jgi:hypothetical protein